MSATQVINRHSILNGTSVNATESIDIQDKTLLSISFPVGWDGGNVTFQTADQPTGTFQDVYDANGTIVTAIAAASRVVALTGSVLQAITSLRYIKIKSASAVAADRILIVLAKG
jgi:hypothetical protein